MNPTTLVNIHALKQKPTCMLCKQTIFESVDHHCKLRDKRGVRIKTQNTSVNDPVGK